MADNTINKPVDKSVDKAKDNPIISIIIAIVLALTFRSFAFEPFNIPSGSMKPTLLIGDYIFVSKYSYGYSRYSFPLGLHIFDGRKFETKPQRGDVVVFKLPKDTKTNYIKRLIGLPGDKIQMIDGVLYLNGAAVPKKHIEDFVDYDPSGNAKNVPQYVETLPNGVSYRVLDENPYGMLDNTQVYTVPEDHYMMLGDNRDNSQDSRVTNAVGFVPSENLVGPARMVFFSSKSSLWKIWDFRNERYFSKIKYSQENAKYVK